MKRQKSPKPEVFLKEMHVENGALEMTIEESTGLVHRMAVGMAKMLDDCGAENYLQQEVSIGTRDYVLLIQRRNGKTPNQLRREAEASVSAAVAAEREQIASLVMSALVSGSFSADEICVAIRARGAK